MSSFWFQGILNEYSGLFFTSVAARVVNDESTTCRQMSAAAIKLLLTKVFIVHFQLLIKRKIITKWFCMIGPVRLYSLTSVGDCSFLQKETLNYCLVWRYKIVSIKNWRCDEYMLDKIEYCTQRIRIHEYEKFDFFIFLFKVSQTSVSTSNRRLCEYW